MSLSYQEISLKISEGVTNDFISQIRDDIHDLYFNPHKSHKNKRVWLNKRSDDLNNLSVKKFFKERKHIKADSFIHSIGAVIILRSQPKYNSTTRLHSDI